MSDWSSITYEHLADDYWYGSYGEFKVVLCKENGFINASKLCYHGGKDLADWFANKRSKELVNAVAAKVSGGTYGFGYNDIIRHERNSNQTLVEKEVSGTYVHPLIIPHIACWVSVEFALCVSDIVNDFILSRCAHAMEEELRKRHDAEMGHKRLWLKLKNLK